MRRILQSMSLRLGSENSAAQTADVIVMPDADAARPSTGEQVQFAACGVGAPASVALDDSDIRFRCASLLTPLLFWAATDLPAHRRDDGPWRDMASQAIRSSANEPTEALWVDSGGEALLEALRAKTGMPWAVDPECSTFAGVLVRADEVAAAYAALAAAAHEKSNVRARFLLAMMVRVPDSQTFGAREATLAVGHARGNTAIKTGWDLNSDETALRTHAVTVLWRGHEEATVAAVLTAVPVDATIRAAYAQAADAGEVLPWHWRTAGTLIPETLTDLLSETDEAIGKASVGSAD